MREIKETITFEGKEDFEAFGKAEDWCKENKISMGSMQRSDPIALMRGEWNISKWRNISATERKSLDGTLTGEKRSGPVTIQMFN